MTCVAVRLTNSCSRTKAYCHAFAKRRKSHASTLWPLRKALVSSNSVSVAGKSAYRLVIFQCPSDNSKPCGATQKNAATASEVSGPARELDANARHHESCAVECGRDRRSSATFGEHSACAPNQLRDERLLGACLSALSGRVCLRQTLLRSPVLRIRFKLQARRES
jgi:hypothetical protein